MALPLDRVLDALQGLAPLELAADWDNVGLLVDTLPRRPIQRGLLTIDLTEAVLDEALAADCELIVAYHPPIFGGMKRLVARDPKQRIVLRAVAAGIALYSPHTALDAVDGGVNDWLADGLGPGDRVAIEALAPESPHGQGRLVTLETPLPLVDLVRTIKRHLDLGSVRLAASPCHAQDQQPIRTVALCAGAGGSVLTQAPADLWWTGEMRHHDVLAALDAGTSVVLCEHTNTERGYLGRFRERLAAELGDAVDWTVSAVDRDPLAPI